MPVMVYNIIDAYLNSIMYACVTIFKNENMYFNKMVLTD